MRTSSPRRAGPRRGSGNPPCNCPCCTRCRAPAGSTAAWSGTTATGPASPTPRRPPRPLTLTNGSPGRCPRSGDSDELGPDQPAIGDVEEPEGPARLPPPVGGRPGVEDPLAVLRVIHGDVRVAEHHQRGTGEPAAQPGRAAGRGTGVVHHGHPEAVDAGFETIGRTPGR